MRDNVTPKTVIVFTDKNGRSPFSKWLNGLKDAKTRQRILARLRQLEDGHYGDVKAVGEGVSELRLFFGSGYRLYFGEDEGRIVIMLCGGDKKSQKRDITAAKTYWKEYLENG